MTKPKVIIFVECYLVDLEKKDIYKNCVQMVDEKIARLQSIIQSAQESANEDAKSSAGDKYETNREMIHAEKEKASHQLYGVLKMKEVLDGLSQKAMKQVELGALVDTSIGRFYISVALGQIGESDGMLLAISAVSPIAQAMKGLEKNDKTEVNGREVNILSVS